MTHSWRIFDIRLWRATRERISGFGYGPVLVMLLAASGCGADDAGPLSVVAEADAALLTKENSKYGLVVEFFGEWVGPDSDPEQQWMVERLILRETTGGEGVHFQPEDDQALVNSLGYYAEVWSPDFEYLVLPLGRFEGFGIFDSKRAHGDLQQGQVPERIQIVSLADGGAPLWHTFGQWQDDDTFKFSAGRAGDEIDFFYDIGAGAVSMDGPSDAFEARTSRGALTIGFGGGDERR